MIEVEGLPPEQRIALAYTPRSHRPRLAALFALDQRLSRIVAQASEPLLVQMRLGWWRDELAKPVSQRPTGDLVLDALGREWPGDEEPLARLVDGWEELVAEPPLFAGAMANFARGRAAPFAQLARSQQGDDSGRALCAATRWALADAAAHISDDQERAGFVQLGLDLPRRSGAMPRALRGLIILEGLSLRALKAGGAPLMEGRGGALLALRLGIFGR